MGGVGDKIQNAGEEAAGKIKETTGRATDNQSLVAEGTADQASVNIKQAGESKGRRQEHGGLIT